MRKDSPMAAAARKLAECGLSAARICIELGITRKQAASYIRYTTFIGPRERGFRGSSGSCAALSEGDVDDIRAKLAEGKLSQGEIAGEYLISQPAISAIARGISWGWLPNPHGPAASSQTAMAQRDELVRRRLAAGETLNAIAQSLGLTAQALRYRICPDELTSKPRGLPFTDEQKAEAVRLYQEGKSMNEIRKLMSLRSQGSIRRALVNAGVRMRPVGERYDYKRERAKRAGGVK